MNNNLTRRDFAKLALSGIPLVSLALKFENVFAVAKPDSRIDGVQLGVQTYSFRDQSPDVDHIIASMRTIGLNSCELFSPQIQPSDPKLKAMLAAPQTAQQIAELIAYRKAKADSPEAKKRQRDDLRQWRLSTPLSYFEDIRKKFNSAGIDIYAYNFSFGDDFADEEIDRGFDMAKALGGKFITSSSTLTAANRVAPFADKHRYRVAWHGHSSTDPNQFASTESFLTAFGLSKYFWANLDIGHYTAWGGDPIAFIREHHQRISNIHLKDMKKNQGGNTVWGQGDTPICDVLKLLRVTKWPIPAFIEYEYSGTGNSTEEVAKCYAFAKKCLGVA